MAGRKRGRKVVLTELKNRSLKGFLDAINTVYPEAHIQLCIVHMVRNSLRLVPRKGYKAVTHDLKAIYQAIKEAGAGSVRQRMGQMQQPRN